MRIIMVAVTICVQLKRSNCLVHFLVIYLPSDVYGCVTLDVGFLSD